MNLILFDDPAIRPNLLPLTFTRPVADLRVGILTIAEKWQRRLTPGNPEISVSFLTEPYLQDTFPTLLNSDNLFINGAVCPTDALIEAVQKLAIGEALAADNLMIAYHVGEAENASVQGLTFVNYAKPLTVIRHLWDIFSENPIQIRADFDLLTAGRTSAPITDPHTRCYAPNRIFLEPGATTRAAILNTESGPIYLGKNAKVSEGAIIVGPFALGDGAEVAFGGKIRGGTTIGDRKSVV